MWKPCKFILPSDPNRASHPYVLWLIGCIAQIAKALGWHQHCNRSNRKPPATLIASWYMKSQIQAKYDIFHPEVSLKKNLVEKNLLISVGKNRVSPTPLEVTDRSWSGNMVSSPGEWYGDQSGWFPWNRRFHPLKWDGFEFWWDFFVADELDLKILRW